jgi:hypothetical protein
MVHLESVQLSITEFNVIPFNSNIFLSSVLIRWLFFVECSQPTFVKIENQLFIALKATLKNIFIFQYYNL